MIILGIDPGENPGAVVLSDEGTVLRASHRLEFIPAWAREFGLSESWPLAAVEGQRVLPRKAANSGRWSSVDANDIVTLAFRAGFTLRAVPALRRLRIPSEVWRGGSSVNKTAMQNQILISLTPAERRLIRDIPEKKRGDVIDAIGIARAAQRLAPKTREYDWSLPL